MTPSKMTVEAWPVTDPGQAELNEDYVLVYQPDDPEVGRLSGSLYIVVDGQGVGGRGQVASRYAAHKIMSVYYGSSEPDLGLRLREAVEAANADLYAYAQGQPELVKTGATLVAAVARGEQVHIAAVGNARAYLMRDGQIHQVTRDHTLVQQLLDEGAITLEEARDHPRRDVVLRSLGAQPEVAVDIYDLRLRADDALVLCTDGLVRQLGEDEIAGIVSTSSPRQAAELLVQKATDRGEKDNVTVVAALLRDGAPPLISEMPHTWDGSPPTFDEQPTLAAPRVERSPEARAEPPLPEDATLRTRPAEPPGGERVQPAPPYQTTVQPAPTYGPPAPDRPQPPGPPPRGYAIDPVTGLPPVPQPLPQQPYAPRVYQPPPQVPVMAQRRGVSVGWFAAVGVLAIILTALMVVMLVNPMGWNLPGRSSAPATQAAAVAVTETPQTPEPAVAATQPTEPPATEEATPEGTPEVVAPVGMLLVEGGAFMRGVPDEEVEAAAALCIQESENPDQECIRSYFEDARPVEEVTLSPFFLDVTEVTNQAYAECVAAGICTPPENTEFYNDPAFGQHPVVYLTWAQAGQYCEWRGKRLPTEAEWEKAAGWDPEAGEHVVWVWGNEWDPGRANTRAAGLGGLSAVQAFPADVSTYGALGLTGNASEWVQDWYYPDYEGLGTLNPARLGPQPLPEPFRVVRGGSFLELAAFSRTGHRLSVNPDEVASWVSFRCAADVAGAEQPEVTPEEGGAAAGGTPTEAAGTPEATETEGAPTGEPTQTGTP